MRRSRSNSRTVVIAVGLIALGVALWLGIGALWPLFILAPGLIFLGAAVSGGRNTAGLAIPGALIAGTAALLFIQNITGYWESWAYAWTLYGVFLGFGFVLMGDLSDNERIASVGRSFMLFGLMAFAGFAFFFEVIIGLGGLFSSALWPWLLIGAGVFVLVRSLVGECSIPILCPGGKRKRKGKNDAPLFAGPVVVGSRGRTSRRRKLDD